MEGAEEHRKTKTGKVRAEKLHVHLLHGLAELLADELGHEMLAHDLLSAEASDVHGLLIPLVCQSVLVDAEDGRVGGVNQTTQIASNELKLTLSLLALGDVLADTHHTVHVFVLVTTRVGIQQHLDTLASLCVERELKVSPRTSI